MTDGSTPTVREGSTVNRSRGEYGRTGRSTRRAILKVAGAGLFAGALSSGALGTVQAAVPTPRLHTDGRWIRDPSDNPVKIRGVATAGLGFISYSWYPRTVEEILLHATNEDRGWYPNSIRLPCGTQGIADYGGIEPFVDEVLRPAVDLLRARGTYAVIDFHLIRPYTQAATDDYNANEDDELPPIDDVMREFWSVVAPEFADDDHVLYELFNEPTYPLIWGEYGTEVTEREQSWLLWRDAAQPWVDLVQAEAPGTPLIIGSPNWTSETQFAPTHPFDGDNLIYASHIYPANGQPDEFDWEYGAPAEDVPVVCTEFGWDPAGGAIDGATTAEWGEPFREWAESYENMGWLAWCFDDTWAPTLFESPGQGAATPWTLKDGPDDSGGFIKSWLADTRNDMIPTDPLGDTTPPSAPPNLTVTGVTEVGAELTWDPSTDAGGAGVTHYDVYLDGEHQSLVVGDDLAATFAGLDPSSTHEAAVVAVDGSGNESSPATVTFETIPYGSAQSPFGDPHAIPGQIPAEDFDLGGSGIAYYDETGDASSDVDYRDEDVPLETAGETGYNIGFINEGEWWEYTIDVETSGIYEVTVNVANGSDTTYDPALSLLVDLDAVASTVIWPTGGWDSYQAIRVGTVELSAGQHILRVLAESGGWNFDWVEFTLQEEIDDPDPPEGIQVGEYTAQDLNGDGKYTDVNGNDTEDFQDVVAFFEEMQSDGVQNNVDAFDFNDNGSIDFQDVVALFETI